MLKIEHFAKYYLDIELTEKQIEIIKLIAEGKAPRGQRNVVNRVMREYMKDALTEQPEAAK